jgi:hypothetical protein
MRSAVVVFALVGACLTAAPASAETRTFVIADVADGYGVDQCLASGARCGALVADAYCQARDYRRAASFRKVDATAITGTIAVAAEMPRPASALVAIECAR